MIEWFADTPPLVPAGAPFEGFMTEARGPRPCPDEECADGISWEDGYPFDCELCTKGTIPGDVVDAPCPRLMAIGLHAHDEAACRVCEDKDGTVPTRLTADPESGWATASLDVAAGETSTIGKSDQYLMTGEIV